MRDKKAESDIKTLQSFMEYWGKFHSLYESIISKERISQEDENKFLETQKLIVSKYAALKKDFEFKYMPQARMTDPVNDILSINSIRLISEKNLKKVGDDWRDSYIFMSSIIERLKNKKRRMEQFNPVGVFVKRFFQKRQQEAVR